MEQECPLASRWLAVCAYLNPDESPQNWLERWLELQVESDKEKFEIKRFLANLSLIRMNSDIFSMHRLLQKIIQTKGTKDTYQQALSLTTSQYNESAKWQEIQKWLSQGQSIIKVAFFKEIQQKQKINFLEQMGTAGGILGRYQIALEYYELALKILGNTKDLEAARLYEHRAKVFLSLGNFQKAQKDNLECLRIRKSLLNHANKDVAQAYANLGITAMELKDHDKAIEYLGNALDIYQSHLKSLDTHHREFSQVVSNLGGCKRQLGYYEDAKKLFEIALSVQTKYENKIDLVDTYANLGVVWTDLNNPLEGEKYIHKAIEIAEVTFPSNHDKVAGVYGIAAGIYSKLENYNEALRYYEKELEINKITLPENHPSLITNSINIGVNKIASKQYSQALQYFLNLLKEKKEALELQPRNEAAIYNNIGKIYSEQYNHAEALKCYRKALELQKKQPSPSPADLALTYSNIGRRLYTLGQYQEALVNYQEAYEIRKKIFGEKHPLTTSIHTLIIAAQASLEHGKKMIVSHDPNQEPERTKKQESTNEIDMFGEEGRQFIVDSLKAITRLAGAPNQEACEKTKKVLASFDARLGKNPKIDEELEQICLETK